MTIKKDKNQQLCSSAAKIQSILKNGNFELVKWINASNENCLFLCNKCDKPWEGVYVQHLK